MQEIFIDKRECDKMCKEIYGVSSEIMMENAGGFLARFIAKILKKKLGFLESRFYESLLPTNYKISNFNKQKDSKIITFLCGSGDNGADGMVAARILDSILNNQKARINVILLKNIKSDLCKMQWEILAKFGNLSSIRIFDFSYFLDSKSFEKANVDSKKITNYRIFKLKSLINNSDIIIDCVFGSGFNNTKSTLKNNENYQILRACLSQNKAIKIACDVPSGLGNKLGNLELWSKIISEDSKIIESSNLDSINISESGENADICDILCSFDYTISMGSGSLSLYDSRLKDIVGKIKIAPLGFSKIYYDNAKFIESKVIESRNISNKNTESRFYILQKSDLVLPKRKKQDSNKGSFGNSYIICGEMSGAATLAAKAAFSFGAGKSIIYTGLLNEDSKKSLIKDYEIIYSEKLDILESKNFKNTESNFIESNSQKTESNSQNHAQNALAIGMGAAFDKNQYEKLFAILHSILDSNPHTPLIFDADMFYQNKLIEILKKGENIALTPHPKEFLSLLKLSEILNIKQDLSFVLENIPALALKFSQKFPQITLLVKGANTFITHNRNLYINPHGDVSLAKGGSGDVLSGLIVSLMAQGYDALNAAINASLAHALSAKRITKADSKNILKSKKPTNQNCKNKKNKYANYALSPLKIIESIQIL
ncbi:NAD(P)H-hydrate dehydratase [Helicobacter saguini]|uniref:ADP-dependent (S)-NAD(P)H-hydrate dehydratase n=1 Tax=Helicobacter saguini TaxID=1548018 RepID=A0A347VTH9_9HELI|nr:NAD(P)H-hydrate dehydratase [Helicobacter saguini]MWV62089.1 NAD(P)H-hydrate dehydratase [Helicobacter saguini]MWV67238.1 NAD(P)H-hydrate dehydratase [Helicobacter saguini]MWV69591.1 NAD(P)H-hydrate dehydratase [Helicobacter saguini]MWV70859.1 NAD(P)H-hydrate dehydratase [Helicobacter saguini]TLD94307.1 NAD(P)H-hydrate dehydratase [Helicobacter saguini]